MKSRAYLQIINYVTSFATQTTFGGQYGCYGSAFLGGEPVLVGDLVRLQSGPFTKYFLSWVVEIKPNGEYLLESILDGSLCNWSNIQLSPFDRSKIQDHWRWDDKQFKLYDKLLKVLRGYYVYRYAGIDFSGKQATLNIRIMFKDGVAGTIILPDWKKATLKQIRAGIEIIEKERQCNTTK